MCVSKTIITDFIKHGENGFLFHKNNPEDLKKNFFEVLTQIENHKIGEEARKTILREYNWDSLVKTLRMVYNSLS